MLADKYVPYNDEWKYKIDVLNTLERIADAVAPVKEEEIATLTTTGRRSGSVVICIDTGHVYVLNSKHQWSLLGGGN